MSPSGAMVTMFSEPVVYSRFACSQKLRQFLLASCPCRRQAEKVAQYQVRPPQAVAASQTVHEHAPAEESETDERICRFCFDGDEAGELISPCRCIGGQKYVHFNCLRMWQRAVLVSQPTHPDTVTGDCRQQICNVCKTEFSCPPPTKNELMASCTGPEIAALIEEGCIIASTESFSNKLLKQIVGLPERLIEGVVFRNWIRGVFLIVKVANEHSSVQCELSDGEDVEAFIDQLGEDARTLTFNRRRFSITCDGPLRDLSEDALPAARRAALRATSLPLTMQLIPMSQGDTGSDGILAVNLAQPLDISRRSSLHPGRELVFAAEVAQVVGFNATPRATISHFLGGPCEDERVSACLVFFRGRYAVMRDKTCMNMALRLAEALASGQGLDTAPEVTWVPTEGTDADIASQQDEIDADGEEQFSEGRDVRLAVFWGYAGWTRCQLMGEIARGSWGMCRASREDVVAHKPEDVWRMVYPKLVFAPRNEMSANYDEQPEDDIRRQELRRMALLRAMLDSQVEHQGDDRFPEVDLLTSGGSDSDGTEGARQLAEDGRFSDVE
eukprot:CAMPEP_0117528214 /NCGR_PEP_ID=MMETSP0784-20121206/37197_1 /TAXON_ID=39447 /ORGANISM="" /LENGTH=556 /DNA_ID=CAMNT_0005324489 /DNA_START=27 /DNA_END=1697 /DNA_ORIENTATION=-